MKIGQTLIADDQAAEAIDPGEGPLHRPSGAPELVAGVNTAPGDATDDPTPAQIGPTARVIVGLVGMQLVRTLPRSATRSGDRFDRLDQGLEDLRVVDVGGREPDREWDALAVDHQVALRARFAAVGRVRPDRLVRTAPPLAGMLELSRLARDQSSRLASPNRSSRARCRRCQTPACCQSRKRRQQVTPLPQPSSWGRYSQGKPVLSTNRMPVRAARSGRRGRPPLGLGSSGGSSGAITSQRASLTNGLAMFCPHYRQSNRLAARF